jgi:DNA mismatch endonuclease (patch repair protein)
MSRVKGKNTQPERAVRTALHKMGYRFRLHCKDLPGKPDIVLPKHRKVIFVHGCFWHGHKRCKRSTRPTSNVQFWDRKLSGNIERDKRILRELRSVGWNTLTIWQCQLGRKARLEERLQRFLKGER